MGEALGESLVFSRVGGRRRLAANRRLHGTPGSPFIDELRAQHAARFSLGTEA
jgi:hypothetical protein